MFKMLNELKQNSESILFLDEYWCASRINLKYLTYFLLKSSHVFDKNKIIFV